MPRPIYPGVYVEEVSFRAAIARRATGRAAIVGRFASGPISEPTEIADGGELQSVFGTGAAATTAGRVVVQFCENAGRPASVIRTAGADIAPALAALGDDIDLLVVPETTAMPPRTGHAAMTAAGSWAAQHRAVYIADPPRAVDAQSIQSWLAEHRQLRTNNTATYFPWVIAKGGKATPPSGVVAGVIARTGTERGVWKAPAGDAAALLDIRGLVDDVTDAEHAVLNPLGINCLRDRGRGPAVYGARMLSSDPEWKYVPVRRLALLVESSLYAGTTWAVYQPSDEPLWLEIRSGSNDFLHHLWRDGALQGATPDEAYFVKCGRDTMTEDDIAAGRLRIEVGIAPLRPAEFIVLSITQQAASGSGTRRSALAGMLRAAYTLGDDAPHRVVFSGRPSTGKLAAARGLGSLLERPVFRVDLSQVVSKYVGETEKNLAGLLAVAEQQNAILFFDEADALFGRGAGSGKRRYANLEVSYLLERIEEYAGIVILAVTDTGDLDDRWHIVPFPGQRSPAPTSPVPPTSPDRR